ncbi:pectate lyase family protein [Winogradskyella thalassocola]|uniref:Por secretion system C-terminal sorting domain-containing protein n=1 Tax=Winogradskyella thalassocola TaxID=262004 RepID=A0A1G7YA08_9FLAO|nr:T9SS type A sorting domain-containing protein [Winogradskyella thalassocola]SDG92820.1 Por secretion system C-terminal sorting domain-containing protein [Winogradskyella thalassocola]
MKKILLYLSLCLVGLQLNAQAVTITESSGWLESAFVEWLPEDGVDSYNVYYTGGGLTDQIIDTQLIRSYGSYYRADVLGLSTGNYILKVVPVIANIEGPAAVSNSVTVTAHDRNGFAHSNGHVPGAYNLDGTLKANAVVIYITENSKNTISLNVIGATTNPCVGLQTILDGFKKGDDDRPLAVRLIGNITDLDYMLNGDVVIENENNNNGSITFEGVGNDALVNGWGLRIKRGTNIEVRNLGFMLTNANEGDNIGLQQDNEYVWVHNCDLFYGASGGDADQAKGDGALDCKRSTYVTMSYNHFWDTGKSNLLGLSENTTTELYITYHHNWYDHSDSRHPRVRFYSAHVYNNYFDGNAKYGSGSTEGSSLFLEGNFFRNCKYPMLTSQQGTDIFNGSNGTFSGEDGGVIKAFNNDMSGETRFVAYDAVNYPTQFDAYVATTRDENIESNISSFQGGNTYNNFDTDPSLYISSLTVDSPIVAKNNVIQYSGRLSGGDINWTFDAPDDDTSYAINTGLLGLLTSYTSNLVSIQGDTLGTGSTQTLTVPDNNDQSVDSGNAIEDMIFTWGGDATDVSVIGLPASGIVYTKNTIAQTITVSGTPTSNVNFSITTNGSAGSSVTASGSVSINGLPNGDEIHNFTASGLNSGFYSFTGANMNSNPGSTIYDGLILTERLKIESSTNISYTTTSISTLTLVFDPAFSGNIKLDGVTYSATDGVLTLTNIPSGNHSITKGNVANLYYIKSEFALGIEDLSPLQKLKVYPNPIANLLNIYLPNSTIEKITIYNVIGTVIQTIKKDLRVVDLTNLESGSYFITLKTNRGVVTKKFLKK